MTESIPRYPLEWPIGWRRTSASGRKPPGSFRMTVKADDATAPRSMAVRMSEATQRLERQIELLGATDAVLSTNVSLTLAGRVRGDETPADPGAAVYFRFRGKATVLACDCYKRVADNVAAIAAHVDALRRIERYGVGTIEQALAGYKALPADTAADWRSVFGLPTSRPVTVDDVQREYKRLAHAKHPDRGGSDVEMAHVNRARDYALAELMTT